MLKWLRQLRVQPLAFLLVILGFQSSPAFAGLNLCLGKGGHVEIEAKEAGCCPSQATASDLSLTEADGSCTSCIDVSLGENVAATLATTASPFDGVFLPAPPLLERLKPLLATPVFPDLGLPAHPALRDLRTVVLRV